MSEYDERAEVPETWPPHRAMAERVTIWARQGGEHLTVGGTITLRGGRLEADPAVRWILEAPILWHEDGARETWADEDPATFLRNLYLNYTGSAVRATRPERIP